MTLNINLILSFSPLIYKNLVVCVLEFRFEKSNSDLVPHLQLTVHVQVLVQKIEFGLVGKSYKNQSEFD